MPVLFGDSGELTLPIAKRLLRDKNEPAPTADAAKTRLKKLRLPIPRFITKSSLSKSIPARLAKCHGSSIRPEASPYKEC
jgi:hypothetical protein